MAYHTVLPCGYVVLKAQLDEPRNLSFRYLGMAEFCRQLVDALVELEDAYDARLREQLLLVLESRTCPSRDIPRTVFGLKPALRAVGAEEEVRDLSEGFEVSDLLDAALLAEHIARSLRQATAASEDQMRRLVRRHYAPVVRGNLHYRMSVHVALRESLESSGRALMEGVRRSCSGQGRTLDELVSSLAGPRDDVVRAAVTLERCGVLARAREGGRDLYRTAPAAAAPPAGPATGPTRPRRTRSAS